MKKSAEKFVTKCCAEKEKKELPRGTVYKKVGRRYVPISPGEFNGFPADGLWLVYHDPGVQVQTLLVPWEKMPKDLSIAVDVAVFYRILLHRVMRRLEEGRISIRGVIQEAADVLVELCDKEEFRGRELEIEQLRDWVINVAWGTAELWEAEPDLDIPEELREKLDALAKAVGELRDLVDPR